LRRIYLSAWAWRAAVSSAVDASSWLRHDAIPIRHDHLRYGAWRHGNEVGNGKHSAPLWLSQYPGLQFDHQRRLSGGLRGIYSSNSRLGHDVPAFPWRILPV